MKTVEKTRTAAGNALWRELCEMVTPEEALLQVMERVRVRVDNVDSDGWGSVSVSVDGGPFINEGRYLLS